MGREDDTDMGGTGEAFLTTHWSLINKIGSDERDQDRALIGLLLNRYWKPVYCYVRRKGHSNEQAKDLTQGFFHRVVLERNLIAGADAAKGRFRSFLLLALDRYLANVRAEQTAQKRLPRGQLVPLDTIEALDIPQSVARSTPENTFHYAWVSTLLERVLEQVEDQCHEDGKALHWQVFQERVLQPILENTPGRSLQEICTRLDITHESRASNMIVTVKRRFQVALRRHLRHSVISEGHVPGEVEEIRRFFPKIAQEIG